MSFSVQDVEIIDDASGRIIYEPSPQWILETSFAAYGLYNGTMHGTSQDDATATFQFQGTSISLVCLLWPTGANASISFDSEDTVINTGISSSTLAAPQVVWSKQGLDASINHIVVVKKIADEPGWTTPITGDEQSHLSIDSFRIEGSAQPPPLSTPASADLKPTSKTPIIVGATLGAIAFLVFLAALAYIYYRRRKRSQQSADESSLHEVKTKASSSQINHPSPDTAHTFAAPMNSSTASSSPVQRRAEKLNIAGGFMENDEGHGRSRWRSSLLMLPGGRVMRLNSTGGRPGLARNAQRPTADRSGDLLSESEPPSGSSIVDSVVPETTITSLVHSPVAPSTIPPSTIPISPEPLPPISPASPQTDEKALRQQEPDPQGYGSGTAPLESSSEAGSNTYPQAVHTRALMRELVDLRAQVHQLSQMQRGRHADDDVPTEPPPEYDGRRAPSDADDS